MKGDGKSPPGPRRRQNTRRDYTVNLGVWRVGLGLASLYLLQHLLVEPRPAPPLHPLVQAALVMLACAALGYLVGWLVWRIRGGADGADGT